MVPIEEIEQIFENQANVQMSKLTLYSKINPGTFQLLRINSKRFSGVVLKAEGGIMILRSLEIVKNRKETPVYGYNPRNEAKSRTSPSKASMFGVSIPVF